MLSCYLGPIPECLPVVQAVVTDALPQDGQFRCCPRYSIFAAATLPHVLWCPFATATPTSCVCVADDTCSCATYNRREKKKSDAGLHAKLFVSLALFVLLYRCTDARSPPSHEPPASEEGDKQPESAKNAIRVRCEKVLEKFLRLPVAVCRLSAKFSWVQKKKWTT